MSDVTSIYLEAEAKMQKILESLIKSLATIRTDRAHPNLLEGIKVNYYDQFTQISRIASIIAEDPRTLAITPFDKAATTAIEKAIITSNLGLNPIVIGNLIKLPIPQLTEERRKSLVKQFKEKIENAKVSIRNSRRDANLQVKALVNNKKISLNDKNVAENKIQTITDNYISKIEKISTVKEQEIMHI